MRIWIEVTSGDQAWIRKITNSPNLKAGLWAPNTSRHKNMLKKVMPGDIVLTHLTEGLTKNKKWKSAIVGVSTVKDTFYVNDTKLIVPLSQSVELPIPIKFTEYKKIESFSESLRKAIIFCLQKYLIEITKDDFDKLLNIHEENKEKLENTVYSILIETKQD